MIKPAFISVPATAVMAVSVSDARNISNLADPMEVAAAKVAAEIDEFTFHQKKTPAMPAFFKFEINTAIFNKRSSNSSVINRFFRSNY